MTIEVGQEEDELASLRRQNAEMRRVIVGAVLQKRLLKIEDFPSDLQQSLRESKDLLSDLIDDSRDRAVATAMKNWYNLPQKWKDDAEIACAAFRKRVERRPSGRNQGRHRDIMFPCANGERRLSWRDLPYHLKRNKEVLLHALRAQHAGLRWENVPCQFHTDVDIIATSLLYGRIKFNDVPPYLQSIHRDIALYGVQLGDIQAEDCPCLDRDFLKQVVEDGELRWEHLPLVLRNDLNFALSISRFGDNELPGEMLLNVLHLRRDPSFWLNVVNAPELSGHFREFIFKRLLQEFAPPSLRSDREFMLKVSRECTGAFSVVDQSLAGDRDFLLAALEQNAAVLKFVSHEIQQLHRDLVVKAIPHLDQRTPKDKVKMEAYYAEEAIWPSFWLEYDFALCWVKAGHGFPSALSREQRYAWINDRGLCMANVIHGNTLSHPFNGHASFMLEVVDKKPEMYRKTKGAAKDDPAVMVTAFAASLQMADEYLTELHFRGDDTVIQRLVHFLQSQLNPFKAFSECILGNTLSTQSVQDTGTNLTLLNQGLETSVEYKKLLAEYVGIPTGKWLRRLQQADHNIREVMAPWSQDA